MSITKITRRDLFDFIRISGIPWSGRLEEVAFLNRIYDLTNMPSTDNRYPNATGDIHQHRVNNWDWEDDWVFDDERFQLQSDDELFLKFLCETIHPIVVKENSHANLLSNEYNKFLAPDGFKIVPIKEISERPVYGWIETGAVNLPIRNAVQNYASEEYVQLQLSRMEKSINDDPELAIGTAKELVEGVCRTILTNHGVAYSNSDDLPKVMKLTAKTLKLTRDDIPNQRPAAETIKRILSNFGSIVQSIAELRNDYGTGHGKPSHMVGLSPRHARLAAGAAATVVNFLRETDNHRSTKDKPK